MNFKMKIYYVEQRGLYAKSKAFETLQGPIIFGPYQTMVGLVQKAKKEINDLAKYHGKGIFKSLSKMQKI